MTVHIDENLVSEQHRQRSRPPSNPMVISVGNGDESDGSKAGFEKSQSPEARNGADDGYDDECTNAQVAALAQELSRAAIDWSLVPDNPFEAEKASSLDPHSPNFKYRDWVASLAKLSSSDDRNPVRSSGFAFKNLSVYGLSTTTDYQKDVGNVWLVGIAFIKTMLGLAVKPRQIDILREFEGVVESGEMLIVLGPPGSGCSTFLKTITGETNGIQVGSGSSINYEGIPSKEMHRHFRGESIYTAEIDEHFPMLSVADTLYFAARARAPRNIPGNLSKRSYAEHLRDVVMAAFAIGHTRNTRVGNDLIRGVSGGERKRITIAEAVLAGASLQAWDNATRGLDSANAIAFCRNVRLSTELAGVAAAVSMYQAPQAAYDTFDKVLVIYEGRQIYFGNTADSQGYFERLGFVCRDRQTSADFLTSMTSPQERVISEKWQGKTVRTPDDFAAAWKASSERAQLLDTIDDYNKRHVFKGEQYQHFVESRRAQQAKWQRLESPYTLSYPQQVQLCLWRGWQRLLGDPTLTLSLIFGNIALSLVLGSVFYNLQPTTQSFFSRGALLFFGVLFNAFGSALEILTLYGQRPIVEKHSRYAFYHPSAEAIASMLTDMPYKITNAIVFNLILYFITNLRREPGAFFFYLLVSFILTLTMSMLFRTIASVSRTLSQAMVPTAIIILALVIFTGFAIPVNYMLGWCRWINYIDPIAYGFEALIINEFSNRNFTCPSSQLIPTYGSLAVNTKVCSTVGALPGQDYVSGDAFMEQSYQYRASHKWRNVGIIIAFMGFFMFTYLAATEAVTAKKSKGEVLKFRRGHIPTVLRKRQHDEEMDDAGVTGPGVETAKRGPDTTATEIIQKQTAVFSWKDVCYDVKISRDETRRILDQIDGWVKPGTLTALMGVSGAGKTTLLDVLATRTTVGVVSSQSQMLVDGAQRDESFQRKTGYVQQQDLHTPMTTVREALSFSALLRQPAHIPRKEKLAYVGEVIKILDMEEYADAIVGVPGDGLNVEQRKRLTIGVELAAKPELLLFLDEPTSGLDSQTAWAICDLMEQLKNSGQAILCTIHQPSAMLFKRFDRLLFLAEGGKTVYFGDIGEESSTVVDYFERNGEPEALKCPKDANPAEWILQAIGAAPGSHSDIDWFETWRNSAEYQDTQTELERLKNDKPMALKRTGTNAKLEEEQYREFAAPMAEQLWEVTSRVCSQYWRMPTYIYSKTALCLASGLFVGLIFLNSPDSHQGLQNQELAIFLLFTVCGQLIQQIMPQFCAQRALYEARERPSKAYSWRAFMFANIFVELPWNALMAVILFVCFYYPVGLYRNAESTGAVHLRGFQYFLFVLQFMLFTSTFTNMVIAGIEEADQGGQVGNLLFMLSLIFCGVLVGPDALPRFWIFMYYVSPLTYLLGGMLSTGVANSHTQCSEVELLRFDTPAGQTCRQYMRDWINGTDTTPGSGGYLSNPEARSNCGYCTYDDTNVFLQTVSVSYADSWRNFGILWVYIIFNIVAAIAIYWLARVPKKKKEGKNKRQGKGEQEKE